MFSIRHTQRFIKLLLRQLQTRLKNIQDGSIYFFQEYFSIPSDQDKQTFQVSSNQNFKLDLADGES